MVVKQSTLGAALTISGEWFAGTAAYLGTSILYFAIGIFGLGLVCAVWTIAMHRFLEVSLGIATGLAMTAV